jgi:hypothetical protein
MRAQHLARPWAALKSEILPKLEGFGKSSTDFNDSSVIADLIRLSSRAGDPQDFASEILHFVHASPMPEAKRVEIFHYFYYLSANEPVKDGARATLSARGLEPYPAIKDAKLRPEQSELIRKAAARIVCEIAQQNDSLDSKPIRAELTRALVVLRDLKHVDETLALPALKIAYLSRAKDIPWNDRKDLCWLALDLTVRSGSAAVQRELMPIVSRDADLELSGFVARVLNCQEEFQTRIAGLIRKERVKQCCAAAVFLSAYFLAGGPIVAGGVAVASLIWGTWCQKQVAEYKRIGKSVR